MDSRPRPRPFYGRNGYRGGHGNGGYGGGRGYGNGGYSAGYRNGGYSPYYGRGAVPSYGGVGEAVYRPLGASTSHVTQDRVWGWVGDEYLPGVWAPSSVIPSDAMAAAEAAAGQVLLRLHPTKQAERRRQEVIDYAKRLIGTTFGCEVCAFGSVPLKTYLPDGDVDLTILTEPADSDLIDDVGRLLSSEEENEDAQFEIKNIRPIHAKVKIIKCVIDNVDVDISFNQIGGVSKVCFLELVDGAIGKNHLFKKTIILIKAWCCHEANIHGSSHWLISTYALEILVLYIFNIFHRSLHGPLEALYTFFEYYSKFEWDKNFLTINGPMPKSSWSNFIVEDGSFNDELLLSKDSLGRLIVFPIGSRRHGTELCWKPMNIVDPLKWDNNLGNSINQENSRRIQLAFKRGALKLEHILKLPSESVRSEIFGFFTTTLSKHGTGERQDLGGGVLFHSMSGSGNGHGDDVSSSESSYADKDENITPDGLTSSSSKNGNAFIDICQHILTSSTRSNSMDVSESYPVIDSNFTDVHQGKGQLPPFSMSNLLNLTGDLGLHLKSLLSAQYNLEASFDKFCETVEEASLFGGFDEDCYLRFLSDTDARTPRISGALSTDRNGRNSSPVNFPQGTGDVPQLSINELQADALNQLLSGTHFQSSGLSFYPPADANSEVYHQPWFQNIEDVSQTYGAGMYVPDMNFPMPPRTDTLSNGLIYPENYPLSPRYMPADKARGTGTYIPRIARNNEARENCKEKPLHDKKQKQKQQDQVYVEKKPDRVNSCNGHAAIESATGEPRTIETAENSEQRYENGPAETPPLAPPRIMLPHHGGGGQGNPLVASTGQPSPPAVTMVTPGVTLVNPQSITSPQHENLQFGTMGPFSETLRIPKFVENFPRLAGTKMPVQAAPPSLWKKAATALALKSPKPGASASKSWPVEATGSSTLQSPKAGVNVTQSRPVEAPASTAQGPESSASAPQFRPEESYQLIDDAEFPPLQAKTRR